MFSNTKQETIVHMIGNDYYTLQHGESTDVSNHGFLLVMSEACVLR